MDKTLVYYVRRRMFGEDSEGHISNMYLRLDDAMQVYYDIVVRRKLEYRQFENVEEDVNGFPVTYFRNKWTNEITYKVIVETRELIG